MMAYQRADKKDQGKLSNSNNDADKSTLESLNTLEKEVLSQRKKRKSEYIGKLLNVTEQNRRKWIVQQGKSHMLAFQDE